MFQTVFKPRQTCGVIHNNDAFHLVTLNTASLRKHTTINLQQTSEFSKTTDGGKEDQNTPDGGFNGRQK